MAARTVEEKYLEALENVRTYSLILSENLFPYETSEQKESRLDQMIEFVEEAREYYRKVEKKAARIARELAEQNPELGRALDEVYVGLGDIDGS